MSRANPFQRNPKHEIRNPKCFGFRIWDFGFPLAGAVVGFALSVCVALMVTLIAAVRATQPTESPIKVDIASYFPIELGRTWTYTWHVQFADGRKEMVIRTRSFEGPELLPSGYAYKFISDLGDYTYWSVQNKQLLLHGVIEPHRNIRLMLSPPVAVYSPEQAVGRPLSTTRTTDDGAGTQTWTTTIEGFEDVATPMGVFKNCLKIRLEMSGPTGRTKAVYAYAKQMGLVASSYQAWIGNRQQPELTVQSALKLAEVAGRSVSSVEQWEKVLAAPIVAAAPADDPEARKVFQQAYERLYRWPASFAGFQADFLLKRREGDQPMVGSVVVTPDYKVKVQCADKQAAQMVEHEMVQVVTHLKPRPFASEFQGATFTFGDRDPNLGARVDVTGGASRARSFRTKDGEITQIAHSFGRIRFLANHTSYMKTHERSLIPTAFSITYYSNETDQVISYTEFRDEYAQVGNFWLPRRRIKTETLKDKTTQLEIELTNHHVHNK
ncbi:MAG: DUF3386 family protein [Acidobacteriota bacterium]|nr:DUF3386 domain-containing protein [Blastocatellia bacterium]MDW8240451.1 DUF3386 family protein [Acidobacteriota bacterium]